MKKKGYPIDFVIIQGKTHSEVIYEIEHCDFIVDQAYSDTPLAGFATEAAWFGKPAVVGGYGINFLKNYIPKDMWPPSKICQPQDIEQAIESLIINIEARCSLGKKAYDFVRNDNFWVNLGGGNFRNQIEQDIDEDEIPVKESHDFDIELDLIEDDDLEINIDDIDFDF